jgi:hypothetical protein
VRRNVLTLDKGPESAAAPQTVAVDETQQTAEGGDSQTAGEQRPEERLGDASSSSLVPPHPVAESPDSGLGGEEEERLHHAKDGYTGQGTKSHVVGSTRPAYFKAKRGKKKRDRHDQHQQHGDGQSHHKRRHHHHLHHEKDEDDDSEDVDRSVLDEDLDLHLPVINEEGEDGGSQLNSSRRAGGSPLDSHYLHLPVGLEDFAEDSALHKAGKDMQHKQQETQRKPLTTKLPAVNALNTKSFAAASERDDEDENIDPNRSEGKEKEDGKEEEGEGEGKVEEDGEKASGEEAKTAEEGGLKADDEMRELDRMLATKLKSRKLRKPAVSYGDLMKLHHGNHSSTKKLFSMVDRLASKHGITDPPPITSASLDPRTNSKMKQHGDESQVRLTQNSFCCAFFYLQ